MRFSISKFVVLSFESCWEICLQMINLRHPGSGALLEACEATRQPLHQQYESVDPRCGKLF